MQLSQMGELPTFAQKHEKVEVGINGVTVELAHTIKGKNWKTIQNAVTLAVKQGLGNEFYGKVEVKYAPPANRKGVHSATLYASPNGLAGFDVIVNPIGSH